jgi:hypothetical protein
MHGGYALFIVRCRLRVPTAFFQSRFPPSILLRWAAGAFARIPPHYKIISQNAELVHIKLAGPLRSSAGTALQIDDKPYDAPYRIIESFEASLLLNCRMDQSRGYVSQERSKMLDLSQFRGYRAADALTRAAPVGRTEFASLTVLFPCSNFVSSLERRNGV